LGCKDVVNAPICDAECELVRLHGREVLTASLSVQSLTLGDEKVYPQGITHAGHVPSLSFGHVQSLTQTY